MTVDPEASGCQVTRIEAISTSGLIGLILRGPPVADVEMHFFPFHLVIQQQQESRLRSQLEERDCANRRGSDRPEAGENCNSGFIGAGCGRCDFEAPLAAGGQGGGGGGRFEGDRGDDSKEFRQLRSKQQNPNEMSKTRGIRRTLALANVFNLIVGIYFIVISIVALVQLRWYHQLTITLTVRHVITSATSYLAFIVLLFTAVVLLTIFLVNVASLGIGRFFNLANQDELKKVNTKVWLSSSLRNRPVSAPSPQPKPGSSTSYPHEIHPKGSLGQTDAKIERNQATFDRCNVSQPTGNQAESAEREQHPSRYDEQDQEREREDGEIFPDPKDGPMRGQFPKTRNATSVCCSILLHLVGAVGLIVVLIIWLLNTGELVRDSIQSQLDLAFPRYHFSNRTNHYTVAIDGMQYVNSCCGSLDYQDFPRRTSGLSIGHYPGSCCGKNIYAVNARVICTPDEIVRARQVNGCTSVLANFYDLISLLVVPVALVCLFVNITIIALITIARGYLLAEDMLQAASNSGQRLINLKSHPLRRPRAVSP